MLLLAAFLTSSLSGPPDKGIFGTLSVFGQLILSSHGESCNLNLIPNWMAFAISCLWCKQLAPSHSCVQFL
ncbi:hypothetical protein BKA59DRAFT_487889 [Fusarium tricinctum]|uniref:Uncharacterized protein n=1 Tax=Fusarium tricinctum TaxID=61284 RepID=A0A8K0W6I6_9HYPO|nr:hypothetical protein BKA59DRAFT_487889 [Fusarium tricinctum]